MVDAVRPGLPIQQPIPQPPLEKKYDDVPPLEKKYDDVPPLEKKYDDVCITLDEATESNKMSCSFCQLAGHDVTSCQSPEMLLLYKRIKNRYLNAKFVYLSNDDLAKNYFIHMASEDFQLKELSAVVIKYVMVNAPSSKFQCVIKLLEHFEFTRFDDGPYPNYRFINVINEH